MNRINKKYIENNYSQNGEKNQNQIELNNKEINNKEKRETESNTDINKIVNRIEHRYLVKKILNEIINESINLYLQKNKNLLTGSNNLQKFNINIVSDNNQNYVNKKQRKLVKDNHFKEMKRINNIRKNRNIVNIRTENKTSIPLDLRKQKIFRIDQNLIFKKNILFAVNYQNKIINVEKTYISNLWGYLLYSIKEYNNYEIYIYHERLIAAINYMEVLIDDLKIPLNIEKISILEVLNNLDKLICKNVVFIQKVIQQLVNITFELMKTHQYSIYLYIRGSTFIRTALWNLQLIPNKAMLFIQYTDLRDIMQQGITFNISYLEDEEQQQTMKLLAISNLERAINKAINFWNDMNRSDKIKLCLDLQQQYIDIKNSKKRKAEFYKLRRKQQCNNKDNQNQNNQEYNQNKNKYEDKQKNNQVKEYQNKIKNKSNNEINQNNHKNSIEDNKEF